MKRNLLCYVFVLLATSGFSNAIAQPPPTTPASVSSSPVTSEFDLETFSVEPKSLLQQRLHSASFPGEAEVRCGIVEPCELGLARNFVVGSDIFGMLTTPVISPMRFPGGWLFYDAFVGYQFLRQKDEPFYANGSLGYRGFSYEDSSHNRVNVNGLTFRVTFAQEILSFYSQGVEFSGFMGASKFNQESILYTNAAEVVNAQVAVQRFYRLSKEYPRIRLTFPADLELINWKASYIDLPSDLHGYLRVAPFYVQNDLAFTRGYDWTEKNFGVRLAAMGSYESESVDAAERYAFTAALGADLSTSTFAFDKGDKADNFKFNLPARSTVEPYIELMGSYQF